MCTVLLYITLFVVFNSFLVGTACRTDYPFYTPFHVMYLT